MDGEYPVPTSPAVSVRMRRNRKTGSRPEVELRRRLHREGLRFRKNARVQLGSTSVVADVVFTRWRVLVFVDGCFWHGCEQHGTTPRANTAYWGPKLARNRARDDMVNAEASTHGWIPIRIWEHEGLDEATARVFSALHAAGRA